jgi:hypothetical protein
LKQTTEKEKGGTDVPPLDLRPQGSEGTGVEVVSQHQQIKREIDLKGIQMPWVKNRNG